jgi:hypothetical protein
MAESTREFFGFSLCNYSIRRNLSLPGEVQGFLALVRVCTLFNFHVAHACELSSFPQIKGFLFFYLTQKN